MQPLISAVISMFLLFPFSGYASDSAADFDKLMAEGDLKKALPAIKSAADKDKSNRELQWRLARALVAEGNALKDEDAKVKLYDQAVEITDKLVESHPDFAPGYLRRATAKGRLALFKGILATRGLVLAIRKDAKKALSLKNISKYDKALAHFILGRAHFKLAKKPKALRMPLGLSWGNYKSAEENLTTAVTLVPDSVVFQHGLGMFYKDRDKAGKAKEHLQKALQSKNIDPDDKNLKEEATKALKDL